MQAREATGEPVDVVGAERGERSGLDLWSCVYAALGGALCGGLAVLFRLALGWAEDGYVELIATANALPDDGWAVLLFVSTALCGIAGWLTFRFAPEASGSGIPHVEDVLATGRTMRWRILLPVKFFAGLCALGAGMSLGREGPTVQMGAAISEGLAQRFGLKPAQRRALIAAGAGAGLTAAFNAPLAGFVFVLEELGLDAGALTYSTGLIATVTSDLVMQVGLGPGAIFSVGDAPLLPPTALGLFLCLGVLSGLLGVLFNQGILRSLDAFAIWRGGPRWHHAAAAGALVAVVAWWFPDAIGGGEHIAERLLRSEFSVGDPLHYLTLLLAIKFLLTVVCYGSGVPGGLFAPLLAMGAALGALVGQWAEPFFDVAVTPALAMAGMVGMFTGSVRVPITGIVLLLEMTNGQHHLLEFTVTGLVAYLVATALGDRPIYEALLERDLTH